MTILKLLIYLDLFKNCSIYNCITSFSLKKLHYHPYYFLSMFSLFLNNSVVFLTFKQIFVFENSTVSWPRTILNGI